MNGDTKIKAYNRARYDVGVRLLNGLEYNITPGSFQIMTVDDVMHIESAYPNSKFFSRKILVPVDNTGKEINIEEFSIIEDVSSHSNDTEIAEKLGQSAKKIEAWVAEIEDPAELHAIYEVAKNMDLPASKLKILSSKIKNKDWLGEYETTEA